MKNKKVLLGKINGLFGVKGWVKVFSYTQPRHKIVEYKNWYLGDDQSHHIEVEQGQAHKSGVIAKLKGIDDRDLAVTLVNQKIWVASDQLETLPEGEYYWFQLIGLKVVDSDNQPIGEVKDLIETGANDVLIVRADSKTEYLIPYLQGQVVKSIDLDEKRMMVDWDVNY